MDFSQNSIEPYLFVAGFLVLASIVASRISGRLGVPALVLFLVVGMLAGSEGPGGIHFSDAILARSIGVLALAFILFAGGLDTDWKSVRPVLWQGLGLATFGVAITALLVGWFVSLVTPLTLLEGLLLGSIVSSTDAAAVFAVLRSRNVSLKGTLKPLLELESGSNDPMAMFLTIGFVGLLTGEMSSVTGLIPMFIQQMTLGALLGYGGGRLMTYVVNRLRLEYEGLYPVLTLAMVLLIYSGAALVGGNGFLAVYVAGVLMGNRDFIHKRSLVRFHDGLAWLMQIAMFVTLGLLVFPSHVLPVVGVGLLVAAFLMLVARPVSVFATLAFANTGLREKTLISWVGLRGAVPIILATFPLAAGVHQASTIFNIVFFIVLTSVLLQGSSIPMVARWLRVDAPLRGSDEDKYEIGDDECILCKLNEVRVPEGSYLAGRQVVEARIPEKADIILLNRRNRIFAPTGATVLMPGDILLVLADEETLAQLREAL